MINHDTPITISLTLYNDDIALLDLALHGYASPKLDGLFEHILNMAHAVKVGECLNNT
jgi:hypothetical protein